VVGQLYPLYSLGGDNNNAQKAIPKWGKLKVVVELKSVRHGKILRLSTQRLIGRDQVQ
jgi:hypothetical protein